MTRQKITLVVGVAVVGMINYFQSHKFSIHKHKSFKRQCNLSDFFSCYFYSPCFAYSCNEIICPLRQEKECCQFCCFVPSLCRCRLSTWPSRPGWCPVWGRAWPCRRTSCRRPPCSHTPRTRWCSRWSVPGCSSCSRPCHTCVGLQGLQCCPLQVQEAAGVAGRTSDCQGAGSVPCCHLARRCRSSPVPPHGQPPACLLSPGPGCAGTAAGDCGAAATSTLKST